MARHHAFHADDGCDAHSRNGGITAWHERGRPLEPPDGEVVEH